jgi:hypothetical protein
VTHTGAPIGQVFVRGVDTGCLLATIDAEIGKIGPGPSTSAPARQVRALGTPEGCGENPGSPATGLCRWGGNRVILHSRPRRWTRHSLRARLHRHPTDEDLSDGGPESDSISPRDAAPRELDDRP